MRDPLSRRARLQEHDDTGKVFDALADPEKITVVQMAPAVRVAWAEYYRPDAGVRHRPSAWSPPCKQMGFDYVFDTNFTADLTIMEEGSEFVDRFTHRERYTLAHVHLLLSRLGAVREGPVSRIMTDNLSTAKSPQQMFGAVAKSYFAEKMGVDPQRHLCGVHHALHRQKERVRPCPPCRTPAAIPDVDVVLTTREIVRMFRGEQINPADPGGGLPSTVPLGTGTGAAVIFGATGGVMDAALRSAYYLVTGKNPDPDAFRACPGHERAGRRPPSPFPGRATSAWRWSAASATPGS